LINLYQNAQRWVQFVNPSLPIGSDGNTAEVEKQTKISGADNVFYSNASPPIGATSDVRSHGTELEVNLNPNHYWTVTARSPTTGRSSRMSSSALVNWINNRMSVWTTIVDPSITDANAATEGIRASSGGSTSIAWSPLPLARVVLGHRGDPGGELQRLREGALRDHPGAGREE